MKNVYGVIIFNISKGENPTKGSSYVGRGSPYGNPFKIGVDGDRVEVIRKFRESLTAEKILEIKKLKGKNLACHCVPLMCHAEVIAEIANENYS